MHQRANDEFDGALHQIFGLRVTGAEHPPDGGPTQRQDMLVEARAIALRALKKVTQDAVIAFGRRRSGVRWGARTLRRPQGGVAHSWHFAAAHTPLWQSVPLVHAISPAQRRHEPPQSWAVSSPFCVPSLQVAGRCETTVEVIRPSPPASFSSSSQAPRALMAQTDQPIQTPSA